MDKGLTVYQLLAFCQEEIRNGNGDKHVIVSDDEECNGFHGLYSGLCGDKETIDGVMRCCILQTAAKPDEVVLLS